MNKLVKKVLSIICIAAFGFNLIACQKEINSTENKISDVPNSRNFVVGFDAEYPPYGFMGTDGKYTGFDLECAMEVCKRTGMNYIAQPIDWDSKDLELNSGNIDCIWNGFTMTGRENDYTFSVPYVDNSIVFAVSADSDINTVEDLKGKNIVVQSGSSGDTALSEEENKELVASFGNLEKATDYNTCFMNLESGFVDAIVVDMAVAKYQMANNNKFRLLDKELQKEQYAIGFRIADTELRDLVQKTIFEMFKDGTYMNIANKYEEYGLPSMLCIEKYVK